MDAEIGTSLSLIGRILTNRQDQDWTVFIQLYGPMIWRWCRGFGVNETDANDVTQEVLLRLFQKLNQFDPRKGAFRKWLQRVSRNLWLDFCEQRKHDLARGSGDSEVHRLLENTQAPETLAEALQEGFDLDLLQAAREKVRESAEECTWRAFVLTTEEGLDAAEAARVLGVPISKIYRDKNRILTRLQNEIGRLTQSSLP
jgi:RNA polymerase sigma factor (sigma-70 family)